MAERLRKISEHAVLGVIHVSRHARPISFTELLSDSDGRRLLNRLWQLHHNTAPAVMILEFKGQIRFSAAER